MDCDLRLTHKRCPQTTVLHARGVITSSNALFFVPHRRLPESVDADTLGVANLLDPPKSMIYLSPPRAVQSDIQRTRSGHVTNSCSYWHAIEHQAQVNTQSSQTTSNSNANQDQVNQNRSKSSTSQDQVKQHYGQVKSTSSARQDQVKHNRRKSSTSQEQVKQN